MIDQVLADAVLWIHLLFTVFVVSGGLLCLRWVKAARLHLPAVAWGALVELNGWVCPLTPLENWLRFKAGDAGYGGGFIEHYILAILYPETLTRETQILLGAGVIAWNLFLYAGVICRLKRKRPS